MKEIYIISGLGADEKLFKNINFSGFNPNFIQWLKPQKNEAIESYAKRLIEQIKIDRPILIGFSFGGMIAIEIAKQIKTEKVILISSAKTRKEIPFYFRFAGTIRLHKLVPSILLKQVNLFKYWVLGGESQEEKELLKNIIRNVDNTFLKWAIDKIVTWKNKDTIENLTHIHGTTDKVLPIIFVKADTKVRGGGHLMVLNRSDDVTNFIKARL